MKVTGINNTQSFYGSVKMNKHQIKKAINTCPKDTRVAIDKNIKNLQEQLNLETPSYKHYNVSFNTAVVRQDYLSPKELYGTVSVVDEKGEETSSSFWIACEQENRKLGMSEVESLSIYRKGFKNLITNLTGNDSYKNPLDRLI